jgi:hypothetical protein
LPRLLLQTQRQLQHSLEVHQRYIHSLMEQEGLAHRIPQMSADLARGPAAPGSVVSEAMPAQPPAGRSMQHQQLSFDTGATSAHAAAAAAVHPSLPRYQDAPGSAAGSSRLHMGRLEGLHQQSSHHHHHSQQQQHGGIMRQGHHQQQQQQQHGTDDCLLIPGDLVPHPNSMPRHMATGAAAAEAAAGVGADLLGMGAAGGDDFMHGFMVSHLTDHDLHDMLGLQEETDDGLLGQEGPPGSKRQRLLGSDDL